MALPVPHATKRPEVGDTAQHKTRDIPDRIVAQVSDDGEHVWLERHGARFAGPFPALNYEFFGDTE